MVTILSVLEWFEKQSLSVECVESKDIFTLCLSSGACVIAAQQRGFLQIKQKP